MNKMDILITCVVLLHRERILATPQVYDSRELVKSVLSTFKRKKEYTLENTIDTTDSDLVNLVVRMSSDLEGYTDTSALLAELKVIFKSATYYYEAAHSQLTTELTEPGMKRSLSFLTSKLYKYYQSTQALQLLNRLTYNLNNNNINKSVTEDIIAVLPQIESLCKTTTGKDPGLMDTLVLSSESDMDVLLNKVKGEAAEGGILKTGWKQLNKMINGGFRKGETSIVCALQHNYKSGMTQSLALQLCRHNKPAMKDPSKKPCIMYISLEDELHNVLKFMYRYLYYNNNKVLPEGTPDDMINLSAEQIQAYIKENVSMNGYELILLRADPAMWTYQHIFQTINKYEANGYEIHACIVDYLAKLPLTGCETNGIIGNGLRDMFNKCRNMASRKGIAFISPVQISTEAKQILRNMSDKPNYIPPDFVKLIAGKGYFEGSKQIDQVVDLELYIAVTRINRKPYLTIQRGKHRGQPIIDDADMYFTLPFPYKAPILENINDPDDIVNTEEVDNLEDQLFNS